MIIAGVNSGSTVHGKPLNDGGAAVVVDGQLVFATAEERLTRRKADGGFKESLRAAMKFVGVEKPDFLYVSSCCEPFRKSKGTPESLRFVDHHLSHAMLAYHSSSFDSAIVVVADAGGNVIAPLPTGMDWWRAPRQQLSVYVGVEGRLSLSGRYFSKPYDCGLGEMYRAFTYYLGWSSGRHAGKVMALSGHRGELSYSNMIFYRLLRDGVELPNVFFHPHEPIKTARSILLSIGRNDLVHEWEVKRDEGARMEIAAIAQSNLEWVLNHVVASAHERYGIENVCLAGGVGLNCTAAYKLKRCLNVNVHVPPGAGDNGQCVGNAIVGHIEQLGETPDIKDLAFLGTDPGVTFSNVEETIKEMGMKARVSKYSSVGYMNAKIARDLFEGNIICWFQGRGEFGSRALGNRCIIASPQFPRIRERLNRIKGREGFNPFAASAMSEDAPRYFCQNQVSPYMTFAFRVRDEMRDEIPAVVHSDGTCRAQIFERGFNKRFYDLISEFKNLSGLGLLLNTSMNGKGEPIVDSVEDALRFFGSVDGIDVLVIGDLEVRKLG